MTKEELNRDDRELEDIFEDENESDEGLNESEGDESEGAVVLTEDALKEYNKRIKKNYKSWDDVVKSEKERDKSFAENGGKKPTSEKKPADETEKKDTSNDEIMEEFLIDKHPEAAYVMDDLRAEAKRQGKSILRLFRESKYFQGEAKALFEDEANRTKVSKPSNGSQRGGKDYKSMPFSEAKKLSDDDFEKWSEANEKR